MSPLSQRLYYRGVELDDRSKTIADIQIFDRDTIHMKEDNEAIDLDSDAEEPAKKKARRNEGNAFEGTVLGGSLVSRTPQQSTHEADVSNHLTKACAVCTFENEPTAFECAMCSKILDYP